jgi:hypothetical protein
MLACVKAYHATTPRRLARYIQTGAILPPVRFWPDESSARRWAKRVGRTIVIEFDRPEPAYPLPDHKPALWTPSTVYDWRIAEEKT